MPGLARKVIICAAVDGLILHPLGSKKEPGQRSPPPLIRVKYGDASISHVSRDASPDISQPHSSFEAYGIVGMLIPGVLWGFVSNANLLSLLSQAS